MHQHSFTAKTPGWQHRLLTTVHAHKNIKFVWGKSDCCIFAAKCIDAQYGTDISSNAIDKYDSMLSCKRFILSKTKTTSLSKLLDLYLRNRIPVKQTQRGDVVLFDGELGPTAGILWVGFIWAMGYNGVETIPIEKITITHAWRM